MPREGVINHRERWNRALLRGDLRLVLAESGFVHTGTSATRGWSAQMLKAPYVRIMSGWILGIACHLRHRDDRHLRVIQHLPDWRNVWMSHADIRYQVLRAQIHIAFAVVLPGAGNVQEIGIHVELANH